MAKDVKESQQSSMRLANNPPWDCSARPIAKSTDQDTVPPVSQLAHNNYKAYTDLLLP
eukprot:SAG31_NODE_12017_length_977_cov_1.054670_2_plen_58_part_00